MPAAQLNQPICRFLRADATNESTLVPLRSLKETTALFYGWGARDRPLRHRHPVGSCVGSPALADADLLSAFLTLSQRSLRFDP
ncbi:MAG: hypothetical protein V2I50_00070 [Desulfuromusa sp.]|nr:hypothetical protein [Desulfuromusa sp.]